MLCTGHFQMQRADATLWCSARASHHDGLSVTEFRLWVHRLSSCGAHAQPLQSMWDPPRPGIKPMSPVLQGKFLTTGLPRKPCSTLNGNKKIVWSFFYYYYYYYFNWKLITLQYCSGFCHTLTWISVHVSPILHPEPPFHLPPHPIPQGCPCARALSSLSHASNLDGQSVSHMVIYMFQCYSLKSSHPRLLPQSPKVCSLHLCLFCCLAYRVIVTIFLNSIYMC